MEVNNLKLSEITPYENNARFNDDAVEYVANSIREFGFQQPIVVDRDMVIIAGHTRYKAAKELGLKTVPVVVADELSDEKVKAYRLADNKTGEMAQWDFDKLFQELDDIDLNTEIDMSDFGFELNQEIEEEQKPKEDISDSDLFKTGLLVKVEDEKIEDVFNTLKDMGLDVEVYEY